MANYSFKSTFRSLIAPYLTEIKGAIASAGGGGAVATRVVTLASNKQLLTTSYAAVTGYEAPQLDTLSGITINGTLGTMVCNTPGLYKFEFETCIDQYSGNNRSSAYMRLTVDNNFIKGTEKRGYHRQNPHGFDNYNISRTLSLTANQTVRIEARNHDATRLHQLLADSTTLTITRL